MVLISCRNKHNHYLSIISSGVSNPVLSTLVILHSAYDPEMFTFTLQEKKKKPPILVSLISPRNNRVKETRRQGEINAMKKGAFI